MTKTVTKKQLLALACTLGQTRLIEDNWPPERQKMSILEVVKKAWELDVPFHTLVEMIKVLDPSGWTEMWTTLPDRVSIRPEEQVACYYNWEKDRIVEQTQPEFVPKYWWDQPFAKWLIAKGLNPTYPFAPPWYPRHVSEREYREMHEAQFPSSRKEKTVTKFITKERLLVAACTGDQAKLIEKHWPAGEHKMSLRWIIYRAAGLDIPFHTIGVLIQLVDPSKWVAVAKGPFHRIDYKASVEQYVRRGEETRPTIEEAMKRPETRTPDFDPIVQEIVYHSGWSPEKVIKFLSEQPRRADMTLKETVVLIEKYRNSLDVAPHRVFHYPFIKVYGDGSGELRGSRKEEVFEFTSVEELEKKLKELIAKGE